MKITNLVVLPLITFLCSCTKQQTNPVASLPATNQPPATGTLNGNVFIVTKGISNINLDSVQISIFEKETFDDFANSLVDRIEIARAEHEKEINSVLDVQKKHLKLNREAIDTVKRLEALMEREPGGFSSDSRYWIGYTNQLDRAFKSKLENESSGAKAEKIFEAWPRVNAEIYFTTKVATVASTETDVDGKFTLLLPASHPYVLCARGQRQLLSDEELETYYWIVDMALDGALEKNILLSNHNELTWNDSQSPVKLVELSSTLDGSH